METIKKLQAWIELEHAQAKRNVSDSRHEREGFYHRYNNGRESALRSVMDKISVLLTASTDHPDCEHGVIDGEFCLPCNCEYKRAAVENDTAAVQAERKPE